MGVFVDIAQSTPVVGQTIGLVRTARRVFNATSPQTAVIAAVEGIFVDCTPSNVKYPIKCALLAGQVAIAFASCSNSVTGPMAFSLVLGQCTSILEESIV